MTSKRKSKRANLARKIIRELLALAFWAHAVYLSGLFPKINIPPGDWPRYALNSLLILFIVNYSLFSDNGWWSVLFDAIYIYFLPFIYAGRVFWAFGKLLHKHAKATIIWEAPRLISGKDATAQAANETAPGAQSGESNDRSISSRVPRLFLKFAFLWSLLILSVNWKPFLVAAIICCLIGVAKAILALWLVFSGGSNWVDNLEQRFAQKINELVQQLITSDLELNPEQTRNAANSIKLYRSLLNFITANSATLNRWAFTISLVITVPFYCYVSFLFSCVYFGISKIADLNFSFGNAVVDSLFMPFAWSALPQNLSIRFIGGIQATFVAIAGYNILFRHLGSRLDKITNAASRLLDPIEQDELKMRIRHLEEHLPKTPPPVRGLIDRDKSTKKSRKKR
jgi:hypothetical protein